MRLAVVVVLALFATAHADDEQARAQARVDAATLGRDGRRFNDVQRLLDCGQAYVDIYNKDPVAPDFEELLFNGAQCYDDARAAGAAIMLYNMIERYGAQGSVYVPQAVARLGVLFQQVGMLDRAAGHLEKLGTTFSSDKGAKDALLEAIRIRKLLDQDRQLVVATTAFVNHYGATDAMRAAELSLAAAAGYRGGVFDKMKYLRDWVRKYGDRVGAELSARGHAELAFATWDSACPGREGLCVEVTRERPLPIAARVTKPAATATHCGPPTIEVEVVARDPKLAAGAFIELAEAEKRLARVARPSAELRARIHLVHADRALETFLAIAPGDPAKSSQAVAVEAAYTAVASEPAFATLAAARLGRLWQLYALQVTTAPIPATLRAGAGVASKIDAYCAPQPKLATPLTRRAIDRYDACLAKASQVGVVDRWTKECARERGVLDPTTFALTEEILPELPLELPVTEELPIQPGAGQRQIYKDALTELAKVIDQPSIPAPKCEAIAKAFVAAAKVDPRPEVQLMIGLTYGRCNQIAAAKAAYAAALKIDPTYVFATSNLGELDYRAGNLDAARKQWDAAIKQSQKLYGARLGLAALELRTMRAATGSARVKPAEDALYHAANAAAVAPTSNLPFVAMTIVALEQRQPALASYFAARGASLKPSPVFELAQARALALGGDAGALAALAHAATTAGEPGALALGLHQLAVRRYAEAATTLAAVKTTSYELLVARGIAARGQGKLADAETSYNAAIVFDPTRAEAHFNLGVLFEDYMAARTADPKAAKSALSLAAAAFRKAGTLDAKALADDCDAAARL